MSTVYTHKRVQVDDNQVNPRAGCFPPLTTRCVTTGLSFVVARLCIVTITATSVRNVPHSVTYTPSDRRWATTAAAATRVILICVSICHLVCLSTTRSYCVASKTSLYVTGYIPDASSSSHETRWRTQKKRRIAAILMAAVIYVGGHRHISWQLRTNRCRL